MVLVFDAMPNHTDGSYRSSASLVDILDRVLDKGLVVAGDIRISLADVELLTIRIRLLICSIDKAQEIGLDWWKADPELSSASRNLATENIALLEQVRELKQRLDAKSTPRLRQRVAPNKSRKTPGPRKR